MPRTTTQNAQIRAESQAKLLNSALKVIAEQGYTAASMRKIAAEAGVMAGLLYHYFENKEKLLQAVFNHCMGLIGASLNAALVTKSPKERLINLCRAIFQTLKEDATFWGLFYSMRWQPAVMSVLGDQFRRWTDQLRLLFEGNLRLLRVANPEIEAQLLYCLIEGAIQQYLLEPTTYPLDAVAERVEQYIHERV